MCGLVVIVARHGQPVPRQGLENAVAALHHRGPDDAGLHVDGRVGLGFRRLSIIDLSTAGHQPMLSEDGRHAIVFNGEIYNYVELRGELVRLGHHFRSGTDTEVLLAAYREWGPDCVTRFNGMWAFVIHDRETGTLFGARDRLGVKPLYVCETPDWLLLASEPRAFGASGLFRLEADLARLSTAMRWQRMDHDGGTCLQGVRQMLAAHRFTVDAGGRLSEQCYWQPPGGAVQGGSAEPGRWIEELAVLLQDAVRLRLRSDVPVGFTLSGGIDSSLLICEAARLGGPGAGLLAFSYQDDQFDEREPIRDTVARTGARLVVQEAGQLDVADLLPRVLQASGEPVHSLSPLANYALFGLARSRGVKVLIGGQGADEVLCGYSPFQWDYWHGLFEDRRFAALQADVRAFARLHGRSALNVLLDTLRRSLRLAFARMPAYRALRARRRVPARVRPMHAVFAERFLELSADGAFAGLPERLSASQRRALQWWPLPMYLRIEDRMSMAHGVEARLPFLDYRLVEHALRMPETLKFAGGVNKVALRRVAAGRVPASVTDRVHKFGFPVGDTDAVAARLQGLLAPLVHSRAFRERGIYDHAEVGRLLARPPRAADVETLLHLAQTELWLGGLEAAGSRA